MAAFAPRIRRPVIARKQRVVRTAARRFPYDRAKRVMRTHRRFDNDRTLMGAVTLGATGYIDVEVYVAGYPASRRVRVIDEVTGELMRDAYTSLAGTVRISNLPYGRVYTVIGYDDTGLFAALVWNGLGPT